MQRIVDFILELDKLKAVTRKIHLRTVDRYENSAEHSWQIAMLALSMAEYAPPEVNLNRVIRMLLVHDIGEIDTGDTMFFVEGGWAERKDAERKAVHRIFGLLPGHQAAEFLSLWDEFEHGDTSEALFARAVDRAMPVLQNLANNGQSWRENGVSYETVAGRVRAPIEAGCPPLWEYVSGRLQKAAADGWFKNF